MADKVNFGMRFMNSRWVLPKQTTHMSIYGRTGCLDEETEIYVFDNKVCKVKLKDLPTEFKVVSYNFDTKKKEIKSAIKIDSGVKECFEIELENGKKIIASEEHVFFDKNNNEIKVIDLVEGDELLCTNKISNVLGMSKTVGNYPVTMGFQKGCKPWCSGKKFTLEQLQNMGVPSPYKGLTLDKIHGLEKANKIKLKMSKNHADISGDKNPSKRNDVRKKLSIALSKEKNPMYGKQHTEESKNKISIGVKNSENWKANKEYQTGNTFENMYGKEKASKIKAKLSKASIGENNPSFGIPRYPKQYYVDVLQHKVRSSWEEKVCKLLLDKNVNYKYESTTFKVYLDDKIYTYTPDIEINKNFFIEVKGPVFYHQLDKMKAFKLQYPHILFCLITSQQNIDKYDFSFADLVLNYHTITSQILYNEIHKN